MSKTNLKVEVRAGLFPDEVYVILPDGSQHYLSKSVLVNGLLPIEILEEDATHALVGFHGKDGAMTTKVLKDYLQ